jgi:hypothetical protein
MTCETRAVELESELEGILSGVGLGKNVPTLRPRYKILNRC